MHIAKLLAVLILIALPGRPAAADLPATQPAALKYSTERYRLLSRPDEIVSVLSNGLTVITRRVASPVLTVRGYVKTGGIYEGRWLGGGLSHLLEHLVAGGSTVRRSEAENRELLQSLGNNSNAYTTTDHTAYFINTTPSNLAGAVDLLTDWLLGAKITAQEYAREYQVVQRELEKGKGEPGRQFYYLANLNRYRVSPVRVPVIGYQEVIQGLSRDDVYDYYKLAYVPNNMLLVVVGDIDPEVALGLIQRSVDTPAGRDFSHDIADEPAVLSSRTVVATFPRLGQASVQLAFPGIRLDDPDLYALDLLAGVLADGESSLLVETIRDQKQLVSGIDASNPTPAYVAGSFEITYRTDSAKVEPAKVAILESIEQVRQNGVDAERLERAKTQMKTARIRALQTSEAIAASMANDLINTGDPHFFEHYIDRIEAVTPEQIQAAAKKYLDASRLITTVLLPAESAAGLPAATELLRQAGANQAAATEKPTEASAISRAVLSDGTVLLHRKITTTPLVYASLYALGGLTRESAENNGIGNLAMNLLERGTTERTARQIAEFWDSVGGNFSAAMGQNTWYWQMSSMKDDFQSAFAVYADLVQHPEFPEDEIAPMQQRILAAIDGQDASWEAQAFRFYREKFYGPSDSPYRFLPIGSRTNVESMTRQQLLEWYQKTILPAPRVLAIFGDIEFEAARTIAEKHLGQGAKRAAIAPNPLKDQAAATTAASEEMKPARLNVVAVEVQKTQQPLAGVVIGFKSDSIIGETVNTALGVADTMSSGQGYPTGYLHEVLRGRGLVYVVHAMLSPGRDLDHPGGFVAYAGTDPRRVNEVVEAMLQNIARLQGSEADTVPGWFERSKELMLIGDAMDQETASEQATAAALDELYGLGYDYHLSQPERIKAVTLEQVRAAARSKLKDVVVTISTPAPELIKIETGPRTYESFPEIDLTPKGVEHDAPGGH